MEPVDVVLLERWVGQRDAEAFQAIVKRHSAMVFSACRRMLGDPASAEDVTQECFLKLATGGARPGPFLGPWLHKMATRRCVDALRSEKRRHAREARYVAEGPQSVEARWETLEPLIDEALAALPERLRVPIALHFLEGLSHEEVAQQLGQPRPTVTYRISRGIERMGAWLRSRGVNVASGVLVARLAEMPSATLPAELGAKLSKMALARAVRVLPHAHWLSGSVLTYGAVALVAVAGFVGATHWVGTQNETLTPVAVAQTREPAADAAKGVGIAGLDAGGVAGAASTEPALSVTPSGRLAPAVAPPAASESTTGTVTGIVVDVDDVPIPNATVRALLVADEELITAKTKFLSAKTAADGRFRLAGVPGESGFLIDAAAAGFNTSRIRTLRAEPGTTLKEQRLVLGKQEATMLGKVFGRDGLPVKDAQVLLHSYKTFESGGYGSPRIAKTDEEGLFKLGVRGAGAAVLRVQTLEWGDAVFQVNVEPDVQLELHMLEPAGLAGCVTGKDGAPVAGAKVAVHPLSGSGDFLGLYQSATDADGRYAFAVLPPDVEYEATVQNEASKPLSNRQRLGTLAAGSSTQRDFRLQGSAHVRGIVLGDKKRRPQRKAEIGWTRDKESEQEAAEAGEDGTYDLELFVPGTYWVYAIPAAGEYDEEYAKKYGHSLTVTLGADQTLDFRLPDTFSLGVRVLDGDGNPIANALVRPEFSPREHRIIVLDEGHTDASGCFRFDDFQPGFEASLMVLPPDLNPLRPESFQSGVTLGHTTGIVGEPGIDYPEQTVVLYGSSGLSGVALDPDGEPFANCRLHFEFNGHGIDVNGTRVGEVTAFRDVKTDASGAFDLPEGVPATSLSGFAWLQGEDGHTYRTADLTADCRLGEVADMGRLTFQADPDASPAVAVGMGYFTGPPEK